MIPAAKPREKPSRRLEGFWPITPKMAPIKVALPASSVNIKGDDIAFSFENDYISILPEDARRDTPFTANYIQIF
jgi:hypothetical protein